MNHHEYGNALVFYGGGLCDCAAFYMAEFCNRLAEAKLFDKVYLGFYSFRCLTHQGLIKEWTRGMYESSRFVRGGYYGTARKTDLASDLVLQQRAIETCKDLGIKWIFLAGGDGSSRQMAEICEPFAKEDIHFCFTMPMTIDGIEGGASFGKEAAVKASIEQIRSVASTTLRTLDGNKYPGIVFELQGRNRDDILASVLHSLVTTPDFFSSETGINIGGFPLDEVTLVAIPANTQWNMENLKEKLHIDDDPYSNEILGKPIVILLSEGASIKKKELIELAKSEGRKLRWFSIGHYSQVNGFTDEFDKQQIIDVIDQSIVTIKDMVSVNYPNIESFTIVYNGDEEALYVDGSAYFAVRNPREEQKATIERYLQTCISEYLP